MMCYLDRTFCQGPCATAECSRQITPEVERGARKSGALLAIGDLREGCKDYREPEKANNGGKEAE